MNFEARLNLAVSDRNHSPALWFGLTNPERFPTGFVSPAGVPLRIFQTSELLIPAVYNWHDVKDADVAVTIRIINRIIFRITATQVPF